MFGVAVKRLTLFLLLLIGVGFAWSRWTSAENPPFGGNHPAQTQLLQLLPSLRASEAESVSGAYLPRVGALFTLDLLRGPNAIEGKSAEEGVRDWGIYLLQTFGSKLTAVPEQEKIAISINFYDYELNAFRQLVLTVSAESVTQTEQYAIWLDGQPFGGRTEP